MIQFKRLPMLMLLAFSLLAGFGCAKDSASVDPNAGKGDGEFYATDINDAVTKIESHVIYFDFDRYDLNDSSKQILKAKASMMKQFPAISVKIEGHCDNRGTQEYNLALGERRAKAAYDFMVMMGVKPSQLNVISYGKLYPAVEGNNEAAWNKNRRDEFRPNISK